MKRMEKHEYYLKIAQDVSNRSTCIRRRYGAVIVKNDEIISTGYNGSPRKVINCNGINKCAREENNVPPGERYELCHSVHAEANAIISASRDRLIDSTLYLVGIDITTNDISKYNKPCSMCRRLIINAGISQIVIKNPDDTIQVILIDELISEENSTF